MNITDSSLRKIIREILIEKSLTGRSLERVAKVIAYRVTDSLKDDELKEIFSHRTQVSFRLNYTPPEKVTWLKDVIVNMNASENFISSAAYEFDLDAPDELRTESDLLINLFMPQDYTDEEVDRLQVKYMGAIRHELEHSGQPTEDLMTTRETIKIEEDIWASLENMEAYYIDKAETPAHVSDWVLQAKERGMEASDVIDEELYSVYAMAMEKGYTEEQLEPVMKRLREIYQFYLMTRWPQQDWPIEFRDEDEDGIYDFADSDLDDDGIVDKNI